MRYDWGMVQPATGAVPDPAADEISASVARILAAADADVAARKPVCRASGRCCHFEEWGHRRYVTAAELLHFARAQGAAAASGPSTHDKRHRLPQFIAREDVQGCPYQVDHLCTAREARPLGCRIYFCDASAQSWQNDVYEKYHGQLRALHEQYGLPYRYVEWRVGLQEWANGSPDGTVDALLPRPS